MIYFLLFMIAFFVAYLVTPTIRMLALRFYVVDRKNHRTMHNKVVSKLGGLAMYAAFFLALVSALLFEFDLLRDQLYSLGIISISSTLILFLGIYDDVRGANAFVKIAVQIVATLIIIYGGFIIERISMPFGVWELGVWSFPFTLLWVLGITNAINLIDGLDGLASGIVFIVSLGLFAALAWKGNSFLGAVLSISLAGACLGFLRYNYFPAKIFMGDTGSLFLGFIIATLSIVSSCKSVTTVSFIVPMVALGVPIFDTSFVLFRRVKKRQHLFTADKNHLHHWLIRKGLSHQHAVLLLYACTAVLSLCALFYALT